jgi:methylthioribose-1-phosphate isomerase
MSSLTSTYEQLKNEAQDASDIADTRPTASNHRKAASKHLAAACHAKAIGRDDECTMHDAKADEHISLMKACEACEAA